MMTRFVTVIAKEVRNKAFNNKKGFKDLNSVFTNIDYNFEPDFDSLDDNAFDLILSRDYNVQDDFINVK
jgi:hypothetical protein